MKDVNEANFGLLIAFLLPGFLLLWGLSFSSNTIAHWLSASSERNAATVGGFLFSTLASLALGLLISSFRWLIVDHILLLFGIKDPGIKFENLKDKDRCAGFVGVVQNHYRYYQYYSNTFIAAPIAVLPAIASGQISPSPLGWFFMALFEIALFLASIDTLKKYYARGYDVLNK